jgi:DNA repair exonuclease SbcCD ATPase subunit
MQTKSPKELIPMLKNAYSTLKDKEKGNIKIIMLKIQVFNVTSGMYIIDLRLAAEIGKSLLENNLALKSNYEDLLSNPPYPTPSNSDSLLFKSDIEQQQQEEEEEEGLRYITAHSTREALVEMLEKKNQDLSEQLETVLLNQERLDRSHTKKAHQLEHQVQFLQTHLDHATRKIQEMETSKKTLTKLDSLTNNDDVLQTSCCHDHGLSAKMEQLKREHDHVSQSKALVEQKLIATLHDLRVLKEQFTQFQFTEQGHEQLLEAFNVQNTHIKELKQTLEEHRSVLGKLRERGVYIPSSTTTSMIDGNESTRQDMQNTLLFELENAWNKHQTPSVDSSSSLLLQPFQAIYNQLPNVDSALESIILKAGVVEKDALDDALSLIGRLENEYDHERFLLEKRHIYYKDDNTDVLDLYRRSSRRRCTSELYYPKHHHLVTVTPNEPPSGLVGYSQKMIKSIMYLTWRWFRFTLIMTIAIFMSLKQGPAALSL